MQQRQKGISYWGVVMAISLFGFAIKVGAAVGPIYLDYFTITRMISGMFKEPAVDEQSIKDFEDGMARRMQMNNPGEMSVKKIMRIHKDGKNFIVDVVYDKREPLIGNLDVIVSFRKSFSSENPDGVDLPPEEAEAETVQ